ncbi:MAG: RNA polymerase sigma factor [Pseudobacter sp.]|uniref:RNA polymerase sigma factor n=1 Tax=Pseudobacter sp. TaxID=2045420 RepID=UPI003F7F436C
MGNNQPYTDQELLQLTANGDRQAFNAILEKFWIKVYTQSLTWLKSTEDAQEITQDVFVDVWLQKYKLPEVNNLSAWLSAITRNKILSALRKPRLRGEDTEKLLAASGYEADQSLLLKESSRILNNGIDLLPPTRKKVFLMSRWEQKSYDEIAREMNISRNGVKDHIVRALNFLREYLAKNSENATISLLTISTFFEKMF